MLRNGKILIVHRAQDWDREAAETQQCDWHSRYRKQVLVDSRGWALSFSFRIRTQDQRECESTS